MKLNIRKDKNYVIFGDCLDWLDQIPEKSVDICYIDPPFFTNKNYEIIWGNGWEKRCYEDRFKTVNHYSEWMKERIEKIKECLKPTGSIFVHCDYRANYKLRDVLNKVFGENNFINEIIWCYDVGGRSRKRFARKHDTIFWYSKTNKYKHSFDDVKIPMKSGKSSFGGRLCKDEDGREYRLVYGTKDSKGKTRYYKYYLDQGKVPEDWWTQINSIQSGDKERVGYNTQKPKKLLKRIVLCSTERGDTVLDCFGGGGTTAYVSNQLGRRYITGDVSPVACRVIMDRLAKVKSYPEYPNELRTEQEWRDLDGHEFAEKICMYLGWKCNPKKSNDRGIDGWNKNGEPIQIKNHSKPVGETVIKELASTILQAEKKRGLIVAWELSNNAYDSIAILKNKGIFIEHKTVKDILSSIIIPSDKKLELEQLYEPYKEAA